MIRNEDLGTLALHQPAAGIGGLRLRLADSRARCEGPVPVRSLGVAASRFEAWSPVDVAAVQTRVPAQLRLIEPRGREAGRGAGAGRERVLVPMNNTRAAPRTRVGSRRCVDVVRCRSWRRPSPVSCSFRPLVGLPALGLVLATNRTASSGLIALHAALLGALAPLLVALLSLTCLPRPAVARHHRRVARTRRAHACPLRRRDGGHGILVLTTATPLSLRVLVGGPLLVGLAPVFLAYALVGLGVEWSGMRALALRAEAEEARAWRRRSPRASGRTSSSTRSTASRS